MADQVSDLNIIKKFNMKLNYVNLMYRDGNTGSTDSAVSAAAINTAGQLASTAIGSMAQSSINKKTQQWNEHMYGVQRADALADWNRQNDYNSPQAQMARLKAANLNPNFIYGSSGNMPASSSVRQSEVPSWNPHAADYSGIGNAVSSGISTYYDTRLKTAQLDNIKAQNNVIVQDALLKSAMAGNQIAQTGKTTFDTEMGRSLAQTSLSTAQENLRGLLIRNESELQGIDRNNALASTTIQEALSRIANNKLDGLKTQAQTSEVKMQIQHLRQQIANLKTDQDIKQQDLNLKKAQVQPGDNIWNRTLMNWLDRLGIMPGGKVIGPSEFSGKVDSILGRKKLDSIANDWGQKYRSQNWK